MARFSILILLFSLIFGGMIFHLYDIQINQNQIFKAKAESQLKLAGLVLPTRGNIYVTDKNGGTILVAFNKNYPTIIASPKEIENTNVAASLLADALKLNESELKTLFEKKNSEYAPLVYEATPEEVKKARDLGLKGVYVDSEQGRSYPLENIASQVIGFVSSLRLSERPEGKYGVEKFYNTDLFGKEGSITSDRVEKSTPGKGVYLTIDIGIQKKANEIVTKLVKDYGAVAGSFIVEDPKTGKILAMGALPDFDPNDYGASSIKNFLNPMVQAYYEPGSVFKPLTMAAGIDSGSITPDTTYYDSGSVTLNGWTIKNWDLKANGTISMTNVLERSVNTGTIFAERKMGHEVFYNYLKKFKLDKITGIDLPGEVAGSLGGLNTKNVRDVNYATASFGQGIAVTPIRLLTALASLANGGVMMRPYVNAELKPEVVERVITAETAKKVTNMMVSAVDKAVIAKIPHYSVAGKTGTAFVPDAKHGGYTDDVINTYVGFAPASDPQFIILIRLDKPAGAPIAGLTVVPSFRELAEYVLGYYNIPPDRIDQN